MDGALNPIPCYAITFSEDEEKVVWDACKERNLPCDIDGIKALVLEAAGAEYYEDQEKPDLVEMIKQYVNDNPEGAAKALENSGLLLKGLAAPLIKRLMQTAKKSA